jgi:hypothetical protein
MRPSFSRSLLGHGRIAMPTEKLRNASLNGRVPAFESHPVREAGVPYPFGDVGEIHKQHWAISVSQ